MISGALILIPTLWMKSADYDQDRSIVFMNEPALPESQSQDQVELQMLTVL